MASDFELPDGTLVEIRKWIQDNGDPNLPNGPLSEEVDRFYELGAEKIEVDEEEGYPPWYITLPEDVRQIADIFWQLGRSLADDYEIVDAENRVVKATLYESL